MEALIHLRHPEKRTKAVCGSGYDWPSSIALRDDIKEVTCNECKDKPYVVASSSN